MRRDWLVFAGIILTLGYPWFLIWLAIERHLPANVIIFFGQNGYLLWSIVALPTAISAYYVWRIYCAFAYGWAAARLAVSLCALMPFVITNDRAIGACLHLSPRLVDGLFIGIDALVIVGTLVGNTGLQVPALFGSRARR